MPVRQQVAVIPGFSGRSLVPGDAGYESGRAIWNAMHDRFPALIAYCESPEDVVAAVRHGRENDLPIAVRSHPGARPARACRSRLAHGSGRPDPGRGVGRMMRRFGLTIDSLLAAQVVTADGRVLRTSERELPDLFWGLRGGGGNFGVVTEFEFALHELRQVLILGTFHPLERARSVLERGRAAMAAADVPDALLWTSFLRKAPPIPWMPPGLVGEPGILQAVKATYDPENVFRLNQNITPVAGAWE